MPRPFPTRQIHLDFHTSIHIGDVGKNWDADAFAQTMQAAHVTSVTVFAKCHHGMMYTNTKHASRHPGLKPGLDLCGEQVEALQRVGIRAPIYLSVQCDEFAANTHPEWICRNPDGTPVGQKLLQKPFPFFQWQILDMASDYQDYLADQTAEVLKTYKPVDGLFFDMCWDQPSASHARIRAMVKAGFNPDSEDDRNRFAHDLALGYMKRYHGMVQNSAKAATVYFNSRPLANLAEEIPYLAQVEIEALPTGGWGYMYFPKNVRFARTFGKPYLGMTARFHKSWGDFGGLKPYAALEYETAQMLAHGAHCSIGDQLHPRGTLDKATYELIGKAYGRVAEREPWCLGATPVTDIGLFQVPAAGNSQQVSGSDEGATRVLTQLKQQFDVVTTTTDLKPYRLLILPDCIRVDAALAKRLDAFLAKGGSILATGTSGLSPDGSTLEWKTLGLKPEGMSPYQYTFLRFGDGLEAGVPDSNHVLYERTVRALPTGGSTGQGRIVEPYFDRTWDHFSSHCQTPDDKVSKYPIATLRKAGKGQIAWISFAAFAAVANHGSWLYRQLIANVLKGLLPEPVLRVCAPTTTEATVMRQAKEGRTIVHLLQYCPERRTKELDLVEDIVPLHNVGVDLALAKAPKQVYLAPSKQTLPFHYEAGRCTVNVPVVTGHEMIVFA